MNYVGIDPGKSGAIVAITGTGTVHAFDMPVIELAATRRKGAKRVREYDIPAIRDTLKSILGALGPCTAALEKVQAAPPAGAGADGGFHRGGKADVSLGECRGIFRTLLMVLGIPYEEVHPRTWQSVMMRDMPKGKGSARLAAMRLFPLYAQTFARVKDDGRADAALLAAWLRRQRERSPMASPLAIVSELRETVLAENW